MLIMSSSSTEFGSMEVGRHLFVLHLHVEMLKIINVVWCRFQDFKFKVLYLTSMFFFSLGYTI